MEKLQAKMIAKTLYGLEKVLADELIALGAGEIEVNNRAVSFSGDKELLYKANYHLRTAIRILIPLHQFRAADERGLYKGIQQIRWNEFFGLSDTFAIDSTVKSDVFQHSLFVSQKVKDAIADQFRNDSGARPNVDVKNPDVRINIYIRGTEVSVALDSSGDSLHLRGYRERLTEAPLSEVLAAGMVLLSGWDRNSNFGDFMCGSGTILAEAGLIGLNIAPGKFRRQFGFQFWKDYDESLFRKIQEEARSKEIDKPGFTITGCDHSPGAVRTAMANLQGAGLQDIITPEISDFSDFVPPSSPGTVIINPPYGERLKPYDLAKLYKAIGDVLKGQYSGYSAWILSSSMEGFKHVGLKPSKKIKLMNGPLECKFLKYELYRGSKKAKFAHGSEDKSG